jgi:hypothetical protein
MFPARLRRRAAWRMLPLSPESESEELSAKKDQLGQQSKPTGPRRSQPKCCSHTHDIDLGAERG